VQVWNGASSVSMGTRNGTAMKVTWRHISPPVQRGRPYVSRLKIAGGNIVL
jgi:hypothetical protein